MLSHAQPYVVTSDNTILSGRKKGQEILDDLMAHIARAEANTVVPLNFSGIEFLDISCADEFLTKLILRIRSGELGSKFIFIVGANPSVKETIEAVLKIRDLAVLLIPDRFNRGGEKIEIMGELKPPNREALEILLKKKKLTSTQLSKALKKNVNIACNRLNALQKMGLTYRVKDPNVQGGGRQYYYESIV